MDQLWQAVGMKKWEAYRTGCDKRMFFCSVFRRIQGQFFSTISPRSAKSPGSAGSAGVWSFRPVLHGFTLPLPVLAGRRIG